MGQFIELELTKVWLKATSEGADVGQEQSGITPAEIDGQEGVAEAWVRAEVGSLFSRTIVIDAGADVDVVNDRVYAPDHGLRLNDPVRVRVNVLAPAPLAEGTVYYAKPIASDARYLQLAATLNGSAIDLTAVGAGEMIIFVVIWTDATVTPTLVKEAAELYGSACLLQMEFSKGGKKNKGVSEAAQLLRDRASGLVETIRRASSLTLDDGTPVFKIPADSSGGATCAAGGGLPFYEGP